MELAHNPLPRKAYTDIAWFHHEQEQLMKSAWVFAGVEGDFAAPGDYRAVPSGAFTLIVLRDTDGDLKAFHNVCRHRGAQLLEGQGNAGAVLVCPYHRWTYDLNGALRGAPNQVSCFPSLDRERLGLKPAAVGRFQNLVFVNPDPAASFDTWIGPIKDCAWPHDPAWPHLQENAPLTYDMKCDWKVFAENAIDGYHLAYLHENTLGGPVPNENVWERHGDHMVWYALDEPGAHQSMTAKTERDYSMAGATMIPGADQTGYGGVYYLFPTTFVTCNPYSFSVASLAAQGPGHTHLVVRLWGLEQQERFSPEHVHGYDSETGMITSDKWTVPATQAGDFQTEDVWICERIQRGLNSPAFELGPLAQGPGAEDPIRWFHDIMQARLGHDHFSRKHDHAPDSLLVARSDG